MLNYQKGQLVWIASHFKLGQLSSNNSNGQSVVPTVGGGYDTQPGIVSLKLHWFSSAILFHCQTYASFKINFNINAAEPGISSFFYSRHSFSSQNLAPTFPTMQLNNQQFVQRFRCVMLVVVVSSGGTCLVNSFYSRLWCVKSVEFPFKYYSILAWYLWQI